MRVSRRLLVATLAAALTVIVLLTVGKSAVTIPGLWQASVQHTRTFRWVPFGDFFRYSHPLIPLYNLLGNVALFVPLGYVLRHRLTLRATVALGALTSALVEASQFIFALGYTDLNDILNNTLGTALGAAAFHLFGPRRWAHAMILASPLAVLSLYALFSLVDV